MNPVGETGDFEVRSCRPVGKAWSSPARAGNSRSGLGARSQLPRHLLGAERRAKPVASLQEVLETIAAREQAAKAEPAQPPAGTESVVEPGRCGPPVELLTPTPKTNAEEWPQLAPRLAAATLVLFPHSRLREELLNLTVEVGPSGARVADRGRVHQDHAVAVRGLCASLCQEADGYIAAANLSPSPVRTVLGQESYAAGNRDWLQAEERELFAWKR